jgi:DNA repair protein RecN (Recombination protein N)
MLIGLAIRDVVLIENLDLSFGQGLTVLTGETGAGKSIILDAMGLALGSRADATLVRRGAGQASAIAIFAPEPSHAVWAYLDEKGLAYRTEEDLVLRRTLAADGRSRGFVNDQAVGVSVLRELGSLLVEVHGQHETVGLLDAGTHRHLLDVYGRHERELELCGRAWSAWRTARSRLESIAGDQAQASSQAEELGSRLAEIDRLAPRSDEEAILAQERALLGAAEKTFADVDAAREHLGGEATIHRLALAFRAIGRARQRAVQARVDPEGAVAKLMGAAADATDRAVIEATEAMSAIDSLASALTFEPDELERVEERLFAIRSLARKLDVTPDELPTLRMTIASQLSLLENAGEALAAARAEAQIAHDAYREASSALSKARRSAGERLAAAVAEEFGPLKLDKVRFRASIDALAEERAGATGSDRVEFQISTLPGAPYLGLGSIASGGELARLALALKAALAVRASVLQPVMIFDEVDQGVGGAVADAVGMRLKRLAGAAQVLAVTHSPQVAARADVHWQVRKIGDDSRLHAAVTVLTPPAREEEIARMLSGARVTEAARAAARALMHA